jgi:hypothetical protein
MKNIILTFLSFLITYNLFSQKFGDSYIEPNKGDEIISIYLGVNNLKTINLRTKKVRKTKNGFKYFSFAITNNTLYYNTQKKSLYGSYISINSQKDTLNFVMSEKNGDVLNIKIFYNDHKKVVTTIEEKKINTKVKMYFSEECLLVRRSD